MSLKRNLIANLVGQGWAAAVGIAFVPVYIDYLGMEAYGLIGFFALMQGWLNVLDMGLTPTLSREMARFTAGKHDETEVLEIFRSIEIVFLLLATLVAVLTTYSAEAIGGSWLNARQADQESVTVALSIAAWIIAFRWLAGLYKGAINGLQKQVWLNVCFAAFSTIRAIGVIAILHWVSPSIEAFFAYQCTVTVVEAVVLRSRLVFYLPRARKRARIRWSALSKVWRFAGGMTAITFLATLLTQGDKLMLSRILSLSEFGYYALASSLALTVCAIAGQVFSTVFPRLVELIAGGNESLVASHYHLYAQLLSLLTIPPALILTSSADRVLFVWTGDEHLTLKVAPLLGVLALGSLFNAFMHVPYALQLAHGWTRYAINVNLISVVVLIPLTYWGVREHGAIAAAYVWMILNAGYIVIGMPFMHRRLLFGNLWQWYRSDIGMPMVVGTVAVAGCSYLAGNEQFASRGLSLAVITATGACCIVAVAATIEPVRRWLMDAGRNAIAGGNLWNRHRD